MKDKNIFLNSEMVNIAKYSLNIKQEENKKNENLSRKELFLFALQREKDSQILYNEIAGYFIEGSKEYETFSSLAKEEKEHMYFILRTLHQLE